MNKLRLTIIVVFITISTSHSQEKEWTLNDCIGHALQNDLVLKQYALMEESSRKQVTAKYGSFLPSVGLYSTHNYNFGSTIDPATNARVSSDIQSNNFALSASMQVFNWSNFARLKRSKLERDKAKYDLEIQKNELIIQIVQSYYQLQYDKEQLEVVKNQMINNALHLNRIEKEVKNGSKPKSDLYDIQANFESDKQLYLDTENGFGLSYIKLLNLLDIKDSVQFSKPSQINYDKSFQETTYLQLYEKSVKECPKVRASELSESIKKKQVHELVGNTLPSLDLNYAFSTFYSKTLQGVNEINIPFDTQINDNKNHFLSFTLTIPLFNKLENSSNIQIAKIELKKSELESQIQKQNYFETLKEAWISTQNSYKKWQQSEKTLQAQKLSFEKVEKRFEVGIIDAFSYFNSKNNLLAAEYNQLKAKYEFFYNTSLLKFYTTNSIDYL